MFHALQFLSSDSSESLTMIAFYPNTSAILSATANLFVHGGHKHIFDKDKSVRLIIDMDERNVDQVS